MQLLYPELPINYWIASCKKSVNFKISLLKRLGFFKRLLDPKKVNKAAMFLQKQVKIDTSQPENTGIAVEVKYKKDGQTHIKKASLKVPSDYGITARFAAIMVEVICSSTKSGVKIPAQITSFDNIYPKLKIPGVDLKIFET